MSDAVPVIIGMGHPFSGDDAAGLRLAEALAAASPIDVEVDTTLNGGWNHLLAPATAAPLTICDAARAGPGLPVAGWRAFDWPADAGCLAATGLRNAHTLGLVSILQVSQALGALPPSIRVYAVGGQQFEIGASLCPAVEERWATLVEEIFADWCGWMGRLGCMNTVSLDPSAR